MIFLESILSWRFYSFISPWIHFFVFIIVNCYFFSWICYNLISLMWLIFLLNFGPYPFPLRIKLLQWICSTINSRCLHYSLFIVCIFITFFLTFLTTFFIPLNFISLFDSTVVLFLCLLNLILLDNLCSLHRCQWRWFICFYLSFGCSPVWCCYCSVSTFLFYCRSIFTWATWSCIFLELFKRFVCHLWEIGVKVWWWFLRIIFTRWFIFIIFLFRFLFWCWRWRSILVKILLRLRRWFKFRLACPNIIWKDE